MELTDSKSGMKGSRRRKSTVDVSSLVYGKIPPQARELEEAILGAIMLDVKAIDEAAEILKPEMFYVEANQRVYSAMLSLVSKSQPIDTLTVIEELRKKEELDLVGGPYYVTKLTNSVVSSANIQAHARIVLEKYILRTVIQVGGELLSNAYEDSTDPFEVLDQAERKLFDASNSFSNRNAIDTSSVMMKLVQEIETIRHLPEQLSGVPTGFPSMDRVTHGWQETDLIVLAARPGVGKTALALQLARNAATDKEKPTAVGFFSMEMSVKQLVQRLLSAESEILLSKIRRGQLSDEEMKLLYIKGIQPVTSMPIFFDDAAALNIFELRAKARRMKNKHNIGLIIIDYLQLMKGVGDGRSTNREQEISNISRNLKALAKELCVPIIALSQLSRAVETRGGEKMPQLSDLRESGAIEQDADAVAFIYRPEYYGIVKNEMGDAITGETIVRFAKYRNGSPDTIKLESRLHIQKFFEPGGRYEKPSEAGEIKPLSSAASNWKPYKDEKDEKEEGPF